MNLRCSFCQTPFTLGRMDKLTALQHMDAEKLSHYDVYCPRCRRATPIQRTRMELTLPNWRDALKELEADMKAHPQQEAPLPKVEADAASQAESKPEPKPAKKEKVAKKPVTKKATTKKKK